VNWQIASFLLMCVVLAAGFAWYERSRPPAKVLSLVAALAALATVGRIAFAPIPNVKPTTDIALFAGYALGPVPGFAVGAVAALASNVFFGQGPWTPWQMVGWGGAGLLGGLVAWAFGRDLGRWPLAGACALAGALFGVLLDGYQWVQGAEQDLAHYLAIAATSLPYNAAHVIGNVGFCLLLGPTFVRALTRYRRRFSVHWAPAAAGLLLALALLLGAAAPPGARASSSSSNAVSYLRASQNADGGFGGARGQSSTGLHTGWVALGFAAGSVNPADVSAGGNSIVDYLRSRAASLSDIGEIERTVLALDASGVDARSFGGRDLVAAIERRRSRNGSWKGNNGWTAFGVLALDATGGSGVKRSARWLARQQNGDGGFGFRPHAASDVDDTGAALQAFAAAGLRGSRAAKRALRFLRVVQNGDGGFGLLRGQSSNAQSTSWAVQGMVAMGRRQSGFSKKRGRTPLRYLRSLQAADGSVRYSRTSTQTPVWVTAQALDAFRLRAFPVAAPLRAARAAVPRPGSSGDDGGTGAGSGGGSGSGAPRGKKPAAGGGKKADPAPRASSGSAPPEAAATPTGPAGPTGTAGSSAPPATDTDRTADEVMNMFGGDGGGGSPWAIALVGGVAALAVWRLVRRRRTST
jgi:energy-coupling factor transport system substrate-specific component